MTKDCPSIRDNIIYDFDQLTVAIKEERSRFKEFLKLPYKNYRIYPKSSWLVKDPRKLNKELIDNIKSWINIDNKIKILQKEIKKRRN
mgnify:CR=1 FL=1